jgi:hypothetical protein
MQSSWLYYTHWTCNNHNNIQKCSSQYVIISIAMEDHICNLYPQICRGQLLRYDHHQLTWQAPCSLWRSKTHVTDGRINQSLIFWFHSQRTWATSWVRELPAVHSRSPECDNCPNTPVKEAGTVEINPLFSLLSTPSLASYKSANSQKLWSGIRN